MVTNLPPSLREAAVDAFEKHFREWNDVTGLIVPNTSYHGELRAVCMDVVADTLTHLLKGAGEFDAWQLNALKTARNIADQKAYEQLSYRVREIVAFLLSQHAKDAASNAALRLQLKSQEARMDKTDTLEWALRRALDHLKGTSGEAEVLKILSDGGLVYDEAIEMIKEVEKRYGAKPR